MTGGQMATVVTAGSAAGGIDAAVGSGPLVSFPALLAVGLPPVDRSLAAAGQAVLPRGVAGLITPQPLQRLDALENITTPTVDPVAATASVVTAGDRVVRLAAGSPTVGALAGGGAGATPGRRVPPVVLRSAVVVLAFVAVVLLVRR